MIDKKLFSIWKPITEVRRGAREIYTSKVMIRGMPSRLLEYIREQVVY